MHGERNIEQQMLVDFETEITLDLAETGRGHVQGVGIGRQAGKRIEAGAVADALPHQSGAGIAQHHARVRHHAAGGVAHRALHHWPAPTALAPVGCRPA